MTRLGRQFAWLFAVSFVTTVLIGCVAVDVRSKPGTTTTIIMLRHADRDLNAEELNAKGQARAQALIDAVGKMGVTAIWSPDVQRNLETVRPLAQHLGIEVTHTGKLSAMSAAALVDEILDEHPGGVVVWVGNASGNLQAMYRVLGGTGPAPVEYGDLYIVTVYDNAPVKVVKTRFGS